VPTAIYQASFASGILGTSLLGRSDITKYSTGLRDAHNVFVRSSGAVSNRPGTRFVGEVMDHTVVHRLIPFERDDDANHVLVFGELKMKVIDQGAFVQSGGSDYEAATPLPAPEVAALDYAGDIDVMYLTTRARMPQKLSRVAIDNWTFADIEVDPAVPSPTGVSIAPNGTGTSTYKYFISATADGIEGFPSAEAETTTAQDLTIDTAENVLTWTAVAGAEEYRVYRVSNGKTGFIGYTTEAAFTDDNFAPDVSVTPVVASDVFLTSTDYPASVSFHQDRLVFSATIRQPNALIASRVGDYSNFTKARVTQADDRIVYPISSEGIPRIRYTVPLRDLIAFCSNGEFTVAGANGTFPADALVQRRYGTTGSSAVKPVIVGDTVLYVDRTTRGVRDLRYAFDQDGYTGRDLTVFVGDIFANRKIAGWCYGRTPEPIVWVYFDDGGLITLTYKREHEIFAWCTQDLGGKVESVCAVASPTGDDIYFIVNRTVGAATKRYIEQLDPREFQKVEDAYFVDCGVTQTSETPFTEITGLGHLEGETISVLADGNVVGDLVVSGAAVTLPRPANTAHAGIYNPSHIATLPVVVELPEVGSSRGRPVSISNVQLLLQDTRGIAVGTGSSELNPFLQVAQDVSLEIPLFSGTVELENYAEWNTEGIVSVHQPHPLPMTVQGISMEVTIGAN
jgi:hypothetical protein